ncbi:MAG: glycoside hydrolase family 3 N-terminal domain-containing protein [Bacteroidota bacterium]
MQVNRNHRNRIGLLTGFILLILLFVLDLAFAQPGRTKPPYLTKDSRQWADSVLASLDQKGRIAQLFMVDAFSNKDSMHIREIDSLVLNHGIGGLIFFQGGPVRQATLTNRYQRESRIPLLIGIDGEWGLNMRLDSTLRFPRQMTLSSGSDAQQVLSMGREIARQCRRVGVHVNFAPDVDVNNNPSNPIINSRSFGESPERVANLGAAYMSGLQSGQVLACAKHFPGHGDTDADSHHALPVVKADRRRLDTLELRPFVDLINRGVGSVMVAHLSVPALDTASNLASTLSPAVVQKLLKDSLAFEGLVFTDALNMKGVAAYFKPGELELKALLAGNDVLLYSENIPEAIRVIDSAITIGLISAGRIDSSVRKILQVKHWVGLNRDSGLVSVDGLMRDLHSASADLMVYGMYNQAPVLLRNKHAVVPMAASSRFCMASVVINDLEENQFQRQLSAYSPVDFFSLKKDAPSAVLDSLDRLLNDYDRVVVSLHNTTTNASKNFGLTDQVVEFIRLSAAHKGRILVLFGNPYILGRLDKLDGFDAVVQAYEDVPNLQRQVAQKLFGVDVFAGLLPVTVNDDFRSGQGLLTKTRRVLRYAPAESVGLNSIVLGRIDSLVNSAIRDSVMPGCQVLIAKSGTVVYEKAFGYHTYDSLRQVRTQDVYDIASVTKIASTALACMWLVDRHKLDLDAKASKYLHALRHTDKKNITIRQLMLHEAGLKAWIPFWKETLRDDKPDSTFYRSKPQTGFRQKIADSLFLRDDYATQIWSDILVSPIEPPGKMVYSDIGLIILQSVIEKVSGKELGQLVQDAFYKPMGLWNIDYLPSQSVRMENSIPTEIDTVFRRDTVQGIVHDPCAAMLGGTPGHAGLFSDARSLAVLMQMLLQKGSYGGRRFIDENTVIQFTGKASLNPGNRRGLLFDKQDASKGISGPAAPSASDQAFGHSGFTGTYAWADPATGVICIFLSNRTYPYPNDNKLARSNLRTRIMQVAYDANMNQ